MTAKLSCVAAIALIGALVCGCADKPPKARKYAKEDVWGHWRGESLKLLSRRNTNNQSDPATPYRVGEYGSIQCTLNFDDTYKLDLAIARNIYGRDAEGISDYEDVVVPAGYRLLTTGHFSYRDSIVQFYDYQNNRKLSGALYNEDDELYLSFIDKHQNEWNVQFVRSH